MLLIDTRPSAPVTPIRFVTSETWERVSSSLGGQALAYAKASGFEPKAGRHCLLPAPDGSLACVLFALDRADAPKHDTFLPGKLATLLPAGTYEFIDLPGDSKAAELAALSWCLSAYRFTRYRKQTSEQPVLLCPQHVDGARIRRSVEGVTLARDLVNTPANDMGPSALEKAACGLGETFGLKPCTIIGEDLLKYNFPLIHAVGRAAADAPRLVDFVIGPPDAPKVTLVGKGVCFDTGGLDIKPSSAMLLMKKDMAGAATALALAHMVMDAKLPVRLRVLIPIVENAVSSNSFRPGDVCASRKGLHVEIGNTDAEGRLILADALALAAEEKPDLLMDFATLTGAARVALGPDLPPFYTNDDALAAEIAEIGMAEHDPVWRLPLWEAYDSLLDSKVADLNNVSSGPFAGSITAALFLRRFVEGAKAWVHFDIYGWNPSTKPGRPEGGETQAARLLYALLEKRYGLS
jgi:leucyl aminopeptidase